MRPSSANTVERREQQPNRLRNHALRLSAALLSGLAINGSGLVFDLNAEAHRQKGESIAETARSRPNCHPNSAAICEWKVRGVYNNPGEHQHAWKKCTGWHQSRFVQHITCALARARSNTVTAEVAGSVDVSFAQLSSKVGYNVTKTTTVTTSDTVDVPKRTSGVVEWAGVYANRRQVEQEYQVCDETAPGYFNLCIPARHPAANNIAWAFTEQYSYPVFRAIKT